MDYSSILNTAEGIIREAGKLVMATFNTPRDHASVIDKGLLQDKGQNLKAASVDLVTETDRACEKLIFGRLREHFPSHQLIGEESSLDGYSLSDEPTWIVDPIDGTTNFVHRHPDMAISIGLAVNQVPVLGLIFNPVRNELYTAFEKGGAFLNGEKISVDGAEDLSKAIVASNLGFRRDADFNKHCMGTLSNLSTKGVRGLRMCGSACISIVSVARGIFSAYYECGPHAWDVCAGAIIVREAGGFVSDLTGEDLNLCSRRYVVAASEKLAKDIISSVAPPLPF
eukprot:m.11601 g.11601  ORF g.11601 m.11601 type:complete len:283 (-) comp7763_c0_seq1:93-941(-)